MKDELMNVKIKFTEQSQTVAELKQEISRLETKESIAEIRVNPMRSNFKFYLLQIELRVVDRR